jgi:hypothetical protein
LLDREHGFAKLLLLEVREVELSEQHRVRRAVQP